MKICKICGEEIDDNELCGINQKYIFKNTNIDPSGWCKGCAYLFKKNNSFKKYSTPATVSNYLKAGAMAFFWFGGMAVYVLASALYLGKVGPIVGWPLFLSATIIVSNILGVLTREWKGVSSKAFMRMYGGIVLLIIAIVLASLSNKYL